MTTANPNIRALAAQVLFQVVDKGQSLTQALPPQQSRLQDGRDKALLQQLCYGVLRQLPTLEFFLNQLLEKKLTGKLRTVHFLLMVGVYQLIASRIPAHAAVAETVAAAVKLKQPRLKGLVNAILRNFQRQQQALEAALASNETADAIKHDHPGWLLNRLKRAYPDQWQQIAKANNQAAPMWLRPNQAKVAPQAYQQLLLDAEIPCQPAQRHGAICLDSAVDVQKLPGFNDGLVSVQDGAPQFAASLMAGQAGEQILDACAAPGGKTAHIAEMVPDLKQLVALDIEESRLKRVHENLARLSLNATVICGDAANPDAWWSGDQFDRILLDAPCSATGVIRRHPDIKWLRRNDDIAKLATLQAEILSAMWKLLKPGGTLLYATCSILPEENSEQVKRFLHTQADAELLNINNRDNVDTPGWQILPGEQQMDGFYYALLRKQLN
ncbi:16S rRNA (cytosine(967)-C(5))-methyltransferase RsmB [Corallincola holothuriorum]|uniref:16S rRNA (cytosine(967)-C(5))-methyltransferase n=1 Tax=Corallincola holothuriorum TaxID=2282215 RepID=A0A368N595_9GAMM|nr:16S rRNA (cytosine(967)-C(5))-methyltransferase RsmB [Corallincola holothuriorum]RCU45386.1 16S rRNA (cytosine(967)-C(5))-methyltransferase RsmB [Corallincola holothuriorum]